jgi:tetratricopeptide (TPR) repeat protein
MSETEKADKIKALLDSGGTHYINGEYAEALADYNKAIKLNPKGYDAYLYRAELFFKFKEFDNAIKDYNQFIKLNPDNATGYLFRGDAYYKTEEYDNAILDFTRSIELDPYLFDFASYRWRGDAHRNKGGINQDNSEYDKAIMDYTMALNSGIPYEYAARIINFRGNIFLRKKEYSYAIADFAESMNLYMELGDAEMVTECISKINDLEGWF